MLLQSCISRRTPFSRVPMPCLWATPMCNLSPVIAGRHLSPVIAARPWWDGVRGGALIKNVELRSPPSRDLLNRFRVSVDRASSAPAVFPMPIGGSTVVNQSIALLA